MIKFEHGMLVLDSSATLEDMRAVTEFQDYVRNREQERILKLLEDPKSHSIEFESITLQAGMEPNWIKKHSDYCPGCIAIALIKGEK